MVKNKTKAQVKIQQTAFMLVGLTVFFALVGLFFLAIMLSGTKGAAEELNEKNAMLLVSKLANSPEFSCGESFGTSKTSCVDFDKVISLKDNIEIYEDFWRDIEAIEIRKIYPDDRYSERECTIGNYPRCGIIKIKSQEVSGEYIGTFVSLCRKKSVDGRINENCEIAKLMVSYKSQNV